MRRAWLPLLLALIGMLAFVLSTRLRGAALPVAYQPASAVVLPAAVQVFLYGGDRYLAADVESVRAVLSAGGHRSDEAVFRLRAHQTVAQLNPCHEDNYWVGNAELTWGGSQALGFDLLRRAVECRFWDQWPPFFYGFNLQFFRRDIDGAGRSLEIAAQRADEKNAAAFRKFAVMLQARQHEDARLALELVRRERDRATDPRLREMLDMRIGRLSGLVTLRDARKQFESRFSRPLVAPGELLDSGVLQAFPADPLGIGYTYEKGEFRLREMKHEGLEALR